MVRKSWIGDAAVLVGAAALAVGALGAAEIAAARDGAGGRAEEASVQTRAPEPRTRRILAASKDYQNWPRLPQFRQPVHSKGHDGTWVVSWYNEPAGKGLKASSFPQGSVIVKEERPQPEARPSALAIMAKEPDGWYWIKATPEGRVVVDHGKPMAGEVGQCEGCHSQADKDMVFSIPRE